LLNRPSSTSSTSSSLAHAFGTSEKASQAQHQHQHKQSASENGYQAMRPPSEASSTAVGSDAGIESDSSYRPSFKRLASQTLGPENTKRALLGPAGWDDDVLDDDDDDDVDADFGLQRSISSGAEVDRNSDDYYSPSTRPMVSLSDRHRRASCPTTAPPGVLTGGTIVQPDPPAIDSSAGS